MPEADIHDRIKSQLEEFRLTQTNPPQKRIEQFNALIDRTRDWVDQRCPRCGDSGERPTIMGVAGWVPCECGRPTLLEETERKLNA